MVPIHSWGHSSKVLLGVELDTVAIQRHSHAQHELQDRYRLDVPDRGVEVGVQVALDLEDFHQRLAAKHLRTA